MKIGGREVGPDGPVFVIAECGSNHAGSLGAALALIDAAAEAGADAAKFQRFRVDSFIVPRENPESLRAYELPDAWLPKLRDHCESRGLEFLCTAFDFEGVGVVDPFVNAHKVGSYEAALPAFLIWVQEKRKPVIASQGRAPVYADFPLRCVSEYPAKVDGYLAGEYLPPRHRPWGVSDHTLDPITVPSAAVALGACVVEKHLREDYPPGAFWRGTPDEPHSIGVSDFGRMVEAIRRTSRALGRPA